MEIIPDYNSDARGQLRTRYKVSGTYFDVDNSYQVLRPIGHGAYGVVVSAVNKSTNTKVAIKKITRAFDDLIDAKRILREVKFLRQFNHDNIVGIKDILTPPSLAGFEDVYIVSDLMETDLHRIIYSRQALTLEHIQYFIFQILGALKYMHSANVLHRDLKPSNLLLNSNCELKICDLGLARGLSDEPDMNLTEYVVTRWYRAPEIMLACQEYTKAIDMWSVGCIFAELINRAPLFPGESYLQQLQLICKRLGRPPEEDLDFVTSDKAKEFIRRLPDTTPITSREAFPYTDERSAHLLDQMLVFHPAKRITVEEALRHPFLESLHSGEEEPAANKLFSFEFEKEELDKQRLQRLMWEEMCHFHPEVVGCEGGPVPLSPNSEEAAACAAYGAMPIYRDGRSHAAHVAAASGGNNHHAGMPQQGRIIASANDNTAGLQGGNRIGGAGMLPSVAAVIAESDMCITPGSTDASGGASSGSKGTGAGGLPGGKKRVFSHLGEEFGNSPIRDNSGVKRPRDSSSGSGSGGRAHNPWTRGAQSRPENAFAHGRPGLGGLTPLGVGGATLGAQSVPEGGSMPLPTFNQPSMFKKRFKISHPIGNAEKSPIVGSGATLGASTVSVITPKSDIDIVAAPPSAPGSSAKKSRLGS